jgi:hypothetical protein
MVGLSEQFAQLSKMRKLMTTFFARWTQCYKTLFCVMSISYY